MSFRRGFFIAVLFWAVFSPRPFAYAQEQAVPRTILVLYDATDKTPIWTIMHLIEHTVGAYLNYYGMKVRPYDVNQGLLPEEDLNDVYGYLTWFTDDDMPSPIEFCRWAEKQIKTGRKFVMAGNIGMLNDKKTRKQTPLSEVNRVFNALGLEYTGNWTDNPLVIRIAQKDSSMVEFERTLQDEVGQYDLVRSLSKENRIYLSLERTDLADSVSAAVVTTPQGGFVQDEYAAFIDYLSEQLRWRIDPFRFFYEAFGLQDLPHLDTTTAFGKRIFYSHIDGDGFRNVSKISPVKYSSEIILDEILRKYHIPITASFISADVLPQYFGNKKLLRVFREITELPNVEVGTHGFSHPLDWDRKITSYVIKGYSRDLKESPSDLISESAYGSGAEVTVRWEAYVRREVEGAAKDLNRLLPRGKKVVTTQWTGNCLPPEDAILLSNRLGLKNINGGDPRFDRIQPSYSGLTPLVRWEGSAAQIYTSASNENIYTNLWTGPYDAFSKVIETFQQTEVPTVVHAPPRRVSPINVYYHFYSGEREESLRALKQVYDYALAQDVIPLYASEYISMVEDFHRAKLRRTGDGGWIFSDYGQARTVRFDGNSLYPDLDRSSGVIGFSRWEGFLYVSLDASDEATLYLTDHGPSRPYLESASATVSDFRMNAAGMVEFKSRVIGKARYVLKQMKPNQRYGVFSVDSGDGSIKEFVKTSSPDGDLDFQIAEDGLLQIQLKEIA